MIETQNAAILAHLKTDVDAELIRQLVHYDTGKGTFTWKRRGCSMFRDDARWTAEESAKRWNTRFSGKPAFISVNPLGYMTGRIFRRSYLAHRVAFAHQTGRWPIEVVDHINGVASDNRWCNLREATQKQNVWNSRPHSNAASEYRGVHLADGLWLAAITVDGKSRRIGTFASEVEAARAFDRASVKYRGEFAYLNFGEDRATYQREIADGHPIFKGRKNATGHRGVRLLPSGAYNAYTRKDGRQVSLGSFATLQEASDAYQRSQAGHAIEGVWTKANGKRFKRYTLVTQ